MSAEAAPQTDRRPFYVLALLLVTTVFAALVTALQADASIRASQADIKSQYYAVLASAELFRQGQQSAFDIATLSTYTRYEQQATVLEYSALQLENTGDQSGAASLRLQAGPLSARAQAVKGVSLFFNDPRYAPASPDQLPNLQSYLGDQDKIANDIVSKQNAAADEYHHWDNRGNGYLTILTILALVFFLLGLAQNSQKLRLFFALAAVLILAACGVGTLWTLIS